jgi:hypothetical protein
MTGSSYFKQLAARTSGNLPMLKPPRSPFSQLGMRQAVESFSERNSDLTSSTPSFPMSEQPGELSSRLLVESPRINTVLSPSSVINSPSVFDSPINLGATEVTIDRDSSSFVSNNSLSGSRFNTKQSNIDPILQSQGAEIKIDRVQSTPQKLTPNLQLEFRSSRSPGDEKSKEIKSDRPPVLSPRDHKDSFFSTDKEQSLSIEQRLPVKSLPDLAARNRIQIGSIEIQITPSTTTQLPPVIPVVKTVTLTSTASLSRGFNSSFGLRQG